MSDPFVSVIVPAPRLTPLGERCLARLLELPLEVEILFVPDEQVAVDPRIVCVASGDVPVGHKRQLGLERSCGRVVALLDDDAYPGDGWLESLRTAFDDPVVGAVAGPTQTPANDSMLAQLGGRVYTSWLVAGPSRWRYRPGRPRDVDEGPSVNIAFRRDVAEKIGFESNYYPGDDTILGDRIRTLGLKIRYLPQMLVYHTRRELWKPHLLQVWRYARHRGLFVWRFGGVSRRPSYFIPTSFLLWAAFGWLGPQRVDIVWLASLVSYALASLAAGFDRKPANWLRLALAIPLTHLTYAVGFGLGLAGLPVPEERAARQSGD